jgi:hypothetical protein
VNRTDHALIQAGIDRRLAAVESLIPARPAWRAADEQDARPARVRVVAGPAIREKARGDRRLGLVLAVGAAVGLLVAYGSLGGGGQPSFVPSRPVATPTPAPTEAATAEPGALRPEVEPRLTIPVRPKSAWTVVDDGSTALGLVYLLDDVGSVGYNVSLLVAEPHGVYDSVDETKLLPLPADLIGWVRDHPDIESDEPVATVVAGLPATAVDVTVTYPSDGPRGQTAQFIDLGGISWNLESPSRKRIVLVRLPDRPLLVVFDSRPEFFDAGIGPFEELLRSIEFESRAPPS